jgi:N-methylhydantoinase A
LIGRVESDYQDNRIARVDREMSGPGSREAYFGKQTGLVDTPVLARRDLTEARQGPLLIDEYDSTIVVPPGMKASCDEEGNVRMKG